MIDLKMKTRSEAKKADRSTATPKKTPKGEENILRQLSRFINSTNILISTEKPACKLFLGII